MSPRTYLFVPGDRPERFDKACAAGADAVILDLEDAVTPERKAIARDAVRSWLAAGGRACVRLNGTDTDWFDGDCALLDQPGLVGVVLPKAERAEQLARLATRLRPGVRIVPIVETALGLWNALELASAPGVERLAFGSVDFQLDSGILGDGEELLYARSRLVLASAIARIDAPVDGVTVAINDIDQLQADTRRARLLGFGAKLCIHPKQVVPVNEGFMPAEAEVVHARAIMAAVDAAAGIGAINLDGKLIDRPVIERARKILERVAA
ncbi:HpcH/HpaI aldolase/citrate lyase family protein [Aromatoleum petrolei]|uniref:CoA ester lyase n=1 Tax=Aromatoleum petrolei TaxID=76116 RepID=A0ABX1MSS9_9RHOO|nr:CoA ester lyase [Aromatoleum petrolei]NMF91022.1 CoA ester lyase [Aromatoleum petrolei]QTQ35390.1 HpcH/HpaI aldolase family protein [Aromatoleum petrolei]